MSRNEDSVRDTFQRLYTKPFPRSRPDFLMNPETGHRLEFDGYCPDIVTYKGRGLAFEYDGAQHVKQSPYLHGSVQMFVDRVRADQLKNKICEDRGLMLVRIPYTLDSDEYELFVLKTIAGCDVH